jgi:hypothetical protein
MKIPMPRLVLVLLAVAVGPAYAQAPEEEDPRSGARMHVGPLYLTPTIVLQDFGVDSNVFNSSSRKESDLTFALRPQIDGVAGSSRARIVFQSVTDLIYYARHATERGINQDFSGAGQVTLGRVVLSARGTYGNTRRRPNEEIDARARRVETSSDLGAKVALFGKLSLESGVRTARTDYDPTATYENIRLAETLNRSNRTGYAALRYALTPITAVALTAEVVEERFKLSPIRDADSTGAYAGVDFNPRAMISGYLSVGYQRFVPRNPALPEFTGLVGSINVAYRIDESTRMGVMFDRRPGYSFEEEEPYYVWDGVGVFGRRRLTTTTDIEMGVRRLWYVYRRFGDAAMRGRTDTLNTASVALNYQVSRSVTSSVRVSHWGRQSDVHDFRDFDGLRIGTSITYLF